MALFSPTDIFRSLWFGYRLGVEVWLNLLPTIQILEGWIHELDRFGDISGQLVPDRTERGLSIRALGADDGSPRKDSQARVCRGQLSGSRDAREEILARGDRSEERCRRGAPALSPGWRISQ